MGNFEVKTTKRYANLKELINDTASMYGAQDAYRYKVKKEIVAKTYNDLKADTMAFSRMLESKGLLGKHIAVMGASSYQWVVAYFGTVNSNSVIVPIDKELPAEDIAELLNRADVSAVVYDKNLYDRIDTIRNLCPDVEYYINLSIEDDEDNALSFNKLIAENQGEFDVEIDNDKMCSILFTSGTTGKAKGVMLTHTSLADNATCMDMGEPVGTVSVSVLPIHHAYCFTCDILACLCSGVTCCFNDSIMRLVKNLNLFNPQIILLVPMIIESLFYKINEASRANPDVPKALIAKQVFGTSLHTIYSGGAYLNPMLIDEFANFGIEIIQGYGMTEFSPRISANIRGHVKKNSVGVLIPGCEAKIEDGEILVKGKSRMIGYYKDDIATEEAINGEWLRTGDLGYVDKDNYVFITGRKKNLIILSNGENVSPEELENKFNGWLVAKELMIYSEDGKIIAEIFPNHEFATAMGITDIEKAFEAKVEEINSDIPLYKRITKTIIRSEEFTKTSSGKIKRKQNS